MAVVYIGLGSNVGDRRGYLRNGRANVLKRCGAVLAAESSVKETKAVDFENQPDFLNQVIKIVSDLGPYELLKELKQIEKDMGRIFRFSKGPREIDLDILLYDDIIIEGSGLTIPHPGILKRDFILEHLLELDPDLMEPVSKKKYSEVLRDGGF